MSRVLVLDDKPIRLDRFKQRLEGHEVHCFDNAPEAMNALTNAEKPYDVAYLDHDLGEGNEKSKAQDGSDLTGMHVVDHIITLPAEKRPKMVIAHTNNAPRGEEMKLRLRDAGIEAEKQPFTD
jgi:CheY-like chemotaxis protein